MPPSASSFDGSDTEDDSGAERHAVLNPQLLQPGVDYLYCPECGHHVASIRLQPGVWDLQCPRCGGECGLCSCRTQGACVGKGGAPVPTHMYVADNPKR